jgi:pyrroline-5-carboxylate reductase
MGALLPIGFLGAGQMATALAKGWAAAGLLDVAKSIASDPFPKARAAFTAATGIPSTESNPEAVAGRQILVLAVKPQTMPAVLSEIRPALVGLSATAFSANAASTPADAELVSALFSSIGLAFPVAEKLIDAVTGLSGSGPAYVYVMIEALADGGVRAGLPRDVALKLAAQTVLGSAKMVLETGLHPGALKDAVASPGGTTIAGLHALEQAGFRGAIMDAVLAAAERAKELGEA